jgi:hypothetical protein
MSNLEINSVYIGVVGYCPPTKFNEKTARQIVRDAYDRCRKHYAGIEIEIVSGLTNVGVLAIAYEEAVKRGWKTIGVGCRRAFEHPIFPVDEQVVVGDEWGDESDEFIGMIDGIIRIGVSAQSVRETSKVKVRGLPTWEYDLPIIL